VPMMRQFLHGVRNLVRPQRAQADAADEVESYLAEAKAEFEARGMNADEATRAARVQLGSQTAARETIRSYGWENMISGFLQDIRYTLRRLRATPGFTVVSIATLALGLGATSAIFSVINGVILKPLPFPDAERLASVWMTAPGVKIAELNMAPSVYFTMNDEKRAYESVSTWANGSISVIQDQKPEQVPVLFATHEFLSILGVTPQLGRLSIASDDDPKGERTVLISDGYWRSHFGGDPAVLGKRIRVEGSATSIIGVLPASFDFMDAHADLLLPIRFDRGKTTLGNFSWQSVAKLKPGVSIKQADADLARMLPIVKNRFPPPQGYTARMFDDARIGPNVRPLKADLIGDIGSTLWVLMATVGIVLLIACANVANLLLVRADSRQQEFAVRAAIGAHWTRIARELMLESVLLGVAAGVAGLGICFGALKLLGASDLVHLPRAHNIHIDGWVLLFTLLTAIGVSVFFGLIPIFRYARPQLSNALRSGGRSMSHSKERLHARSILVVVQVALALILLVSSGLMIRTFQNLRRVDPGFRNASEIQTVRIGIPDAQVKEPERVLRMEEAMLNQIADISGVKSASIASAVPMGGNVTNDPIYAADKPYREGTLPPVRRFRWVSPGYFKTMDQRMIAGRDLTWPEINGALPVAVVSENLAREYWRTPQAALSKRIRTTLKDDWYEVVGVVADEYADGVDKPPPALVYWPLFQKNFESDSVAIARYVCFVVRTPRAGSIALQSEIRNAVWKLNGTLPLAEVNTLNTYYERSLARTSFTLILLAVAGCMALILGVIGIYGVISYSVVQRSREIGIRVALGSSFGEVIKLFVHNGLVLSIVGCACGIVAALGLTRLMKSLLFSVSTSDPLTYIAMSAALILAAALASYLPARRATRVDPVNALKAD
jgi:putative ABC transport system permease protein